MYTRSAVIRWQGSAEGGGEYKNLRTAVQELRFPTTCQCYRAIDILIEESMCENALRKMFTYQTGHLRCHLGKFHCLVEVD
jgi:hypothetical protein